MLSWLSMCEKVEGINDPLFETQNGSVSVNHLLVSKKKTQETFIRYSSLSSSLFFLSVLLGL